MHYKECFEIMRKDRNSYSKTDLEANFMRMKEDHMLNGQLKPAYNVQIAVENYFIVHSYVSNDRTNYNTLIPVPPKHKEAFGDVLEDINIEKKEQNGYTQTYEVYGCSDCSGCEHKPKCLYKYNPDKDVDKNKVMKINEVWEELREKSHFNIQSKKGILKRQTRSIQTEGHFGDIKENGDFRRFNYRSSDKVYKEFMLFTIGRNVNKYHRFLYAKLKKF